MRRKLALILCSLLLAFTAACTQQTPIPTASLTGTAAPAAEATPSPIPTPAPTLALTPEPTVIPTVSPAPTPASTTIALTVSQAMIDKMQSYMTSVPVAAFKLQDENGKIWTLDDLKGKIVLLNFWATWCGPCVGEMPEFQKFTDQYGSDQFLILSVCSTSLETGGNPPFKDQDVQLATDTVMKFIKTQNFTYPILFDTDGSVWKAYHQDYVPVNYILDTKGNIRLLFPGAFPDDETLLAAFEAVRRADSGE